MCNGGDQGIAVIVEAVLGSIQRRELHSADLVDGAEFALGNAQFLQTFRTAPANLDASMNQTFMPHPDLSIAPLIKPSR